MKKHLTFLLVLATTAGICQGVMGPVIGYSQGWPATSEGHAVHMVHIAPTNLAMGNRGRLLFWGARSDAFANPFIWNPYGGGTYGTWTPTGEQLLNYDMYCCGQTLMANGKVITTGSNYDDQTGFPNNRVSVFDPATDTWDALSAPYWMNKNRYYPTTIRMPYGETVSAGGMGAISGDPEIMWIRNGPFEYIKPSLTGPGPVAAWD